jgi:hypothetical protein
MGKLLSLGADPRRYYLCLLGPLALGLSAGMQITMTALLILGPASAQGVWDQLTTYGQEMIRPEHDLVIYVAGCLLMLFMAWVLVWYWRAKLAGSKGSQAQEFMTATAWLQGGLAAGTMFVYVLLLGSGAFAPAPQSGASGLGPPARELGQLIMLAPGLIALVWAAFDLEYGFCLAVRAAFQAGQHRGPSGRSQDSRTRHRGEAHFLSKGESQPFWRRLLWPLEAALERWQRQIGGVLCFAVPVMIILVVGVPPGTWRYLSGLFMTVDECHHLNFFFMGPALSFSHGNAFGTDIYSQYGIGWPLLASILSHFSPLTYGRLAGMEIVFGCVYYVALFFLLRRCFRDAAWAAFGAILALYWQIFSGLTAGEVIWQYPSSTMMRHPLDVWFFLTLALHQRSGRIRWAAAAGLAAALGVFLETETGIYLVATFFIYWVLQAGLGPDEGRPVGWRGWALPPAAFGAAAAATLLPLLFYASRGTLFTRTFWHGWLEALFAYGSLGLGSLPIAEVPGGALICFMIIVTLYLGVIAWALFRGLHRTAKRGEVLLAALAAYGLAVLLLFVNRSHPYNLCHASPPFAVLLAALMLRSHGAVASLRRHPSIPYVLTGFLTLLLLTKGSFRCYPSILSSLLGNKPPSGVSLRLDPPDISGLPPEYETFAREVRDICSAIQALAPDGKGVAILDPEDTLLYSASNACPWSRYASLFHMALTQKSLEDMRHALIARAPKYVVIHGPSATQPSMWDFVWAPLYEVVTSGYALRHTVGPYQIWQRPDQP